MRQTQTSINNVPANIINDIWTEAKGVNLSEVWTGTTRFQILRTRLLREYKWVTGRHTKIQKTTRPESFGLEAWTKLRQETSGNHIAEWAEESAKLHAARRNRGIYEVSTDDKDYFNVIVNASLQLEKYCSCCAVHCEKDNQRKPLTCTTLTDASTGQLGSENKRACGKVKRKHMDHFAEEGCVGSFHCGLVNVQKLPAWDEKNVKSKAEVVRQAKKN